MYIYNMSNRPLILSLLCVTFFFSGKNVFAQNEALQKHENILIQPPYLNVGDTVAIVAPSGILKNRTREIKKAKDLIESWGLEVVIEKNVFNKNNHFAGTDEERSEDLQKAMDNKAIKAIWCARGGYGTVRVLDKLDYTEFRKNPKWIIGYSDITALHNQVHNEGFESIHAIMCTSLQDDPDEIKESIQTFKDAIFGKPLKYNLKGSKYNKAGSVTAPIIGGNLSILYSMLGSKTSVDTSGKILFIEDIGEYKYHIDRMLQSLKRAGYFNNCKGVVVGDMTKLRKNTTLWGSSVEQLIIDALKEYNFPIAFNMPAGHEKDNRAIILGKIVNLTVNNEHSTIIF